MLSPIEFNYWGTVISLLADIYVPQTFTICFFENDAILEDRSLKELLLPNNETQHQFVKLNYHRNFNESFKNNVYNFSAKREELNTRQLIIKDDDILQLIVALETNFCQAFIAFQEDISRFARAFYHANRYADWHSLHYYFIFGYIKESNFNRADFLNEYIFIDQPNILVVEGQSQNSPTFNILTNKFTGSLNDKPQELYQIDVYDAETGDFAVGAKMLNANKLLDLNGRELILAAFDYRPFSVLDYEKQPKIRDRAKDSVADSVHIDGTETRLLLTFCELYKCTIEIDTSEGEEWGLVYSNGSAYGLMKLIMNRKAHLVVGAYYLLDYKYVRATVYLGRSGVTCMVPAPSRTTNWDLPFRPFSSLLWLCIIAYLTIEIIALMIIRRTEHHITAEPHRDWQDSFGFGFTTVLKLFTSQSSKYTVNSNTIRTMLFSLFAVDIMVTSLYGAGLASVLTLPTLSEAPDSLERMVKYNLPWSATSWDWVEAIRGSSDPMILKLLAKYHIKSLEEMQEAAKTKFEGFVLERMSYGHFGNTDYLTDEALEHLKLMIDDLYFQYTIGLVPRGWAFAQKFNDLIHAWHAGGFDKYWEWKVADEFMDNHQQNLIANSMFPHINLGPVKLDLGNFAGLIMIWIAGIFISLGAFVLEFIHFHKIKKAQITSEKK